MTTLDELVRDEDGIPVNGSLHVGILCDEISKAFAVAAENYKKAGAAGVGSEDYRISLREGDDALIAIHPKLQWFLECILEQNHDFTDEVPYSDVLEPEDA